MNISITKKDEEWLSVRFGYDEEFIEVLKDEIVPAFRQWDASNKRWLIHISFLEGFIGLAHQYFDDVRVEPGLLLKPANGKRDEIFTELFSMIGDEYLAAVYKSLAQAFHPDHAGDVAIMKRINIAYQNRKQGGFNANA